MRDGTNILMVLRQRKIWIRTAILFCVAFSPIAPVNLGFAQQKENSGNKLAAADAAGVTDSFKERVKQYVKLREQLEGKLPKLSTEAKPADIEAHQDAFGNLLRAARANAKPGDLFTTEVAQYFRLVIKDEFKGQRLKELRGTVLNSDTKGVPLRISYTYPETKEMVEMPPTLLLRLPELPKQLRYRFVGRHLLLLDRESLLIVDYMPNALP
jgi:hypothetical protein